MSDIIQYGCSECGQLFFKKKRGIFYPPFKCPLCGGLVMWLATDDVVSDILDNYEDIEDE